MAYNELDALDAHWCILKSLLIESESKSEMQLFWMIKYIFYHKQHN